METFKEVGEKAGLSGERLLLYVRYMLARWKDKESLMCQTGYAQEWAGKHFIQIDRFAPSSKKCNHCGNVNKALRLSDREWVCPSCRAVIDRDFNAAKNIRDIGINTVRNTGINACGDHAEVRRVGEARI